MKKELLLGTMVVGFAIGAIANAEPAQDVEIKNSYLNVTSVNKQEDAELQRVKIDKCFLSIIRVNLGGKEVPVEVQKEK